MTRSELVGHIPIWLGIYYYQDDSLNSTFYFKRHLSTLPSNFSARDRFFTEYIRALIALKFYQPEQAQDTVSKVLPRLFYSPSTALDIWTKSLAIMDSSAFKRSTQQFLELMATEKPLSRIDSFRFYSYGAEKSLELGMWNQFRFFGKDLERFYRSSTFQFKLGR